MALVSADGLNINVSTHSRPEAAGHAGRHRQFSRRVSTHSRPEAAGPEDIAKYGRVDCFNSQPPGGGWRCCWRCNHHRVRFNSQPPGGGWLPLGVYGVTDSQFQLTAARRRLA